MMDKTFFRFFAAFLVLLGIAFAVMLFASSKLPAPSSVDIVANPK